MVTQWWWQEKVVVAKETEKTIAKAREIYRPMGERGALMFFLINQMHVISHMYQVMITTASTCQ